MVSAGFTMMPGSEKCVATQASGLASKAFCGILGPAQVFGNDDLRGKGDIEGVASFPLTMELDFSALDRLRAPPVPARHFGSARSVLRIAYRTRTCFQHD